MSDLFNCSLDYLLKDAEETDYKSQPDKDTVFPRKRIRERKSEKIVLGMPLWHIGRNARGFVAVGLNARGIIAVGLASSRNRIPWNVIHRCVIAWNDVSWLAFTWSVCYWWIIRRLHFDRSICDPGAISLGIISIGAIAKGNFSVGALAIGKYFALGDNAQAMIAIGDTEATGTVFQKIGELSSQDTMAVNHSLDTVVPAYFSWAKEIIKLFL